MRRGLVMMAVGLALAACAGQQSPGQSATPEQIYKDAHSILQSADYKRALGWYEALLARFPSSQYAPQALLDSAFAQYKSENQAQALALLDRFDRLYSGSEQADYALYLRGIVLFNIDQSVFSSWTRQDWADRDQKANRQAYDTFRQLVERYPQSRYVKPAKERMESIFQALARHELSVARYYMRRGAYVAAVARAQQVLKEYGSTQYAEDALALMVLAYKRLQFLQLSQDAYKQLKQRYPKSAHL